MAQRESVLALVEKATSLGDVRGVTQAAGVSPSHAPPDLILRVDLYGTALVLEEFGTVISTGGSGTLPMLQPDLVTDSLLAYQLSKRGNVLRVMAEAVNWGKRERGSMRSARGSSSRRWPETN